MADYKFIFKLTPNERDVVIDTSVLVNGYPDVEYPIPFIPTSQLGYVIDTDTFKYIDPSIIPSIQGVYPSRLEIEIIADPEILKFYSHNNEKNFNQFAMQFDYTFSQRSHPLWQESSDKTYNYIDFVFNIRTNTVEDQETYSISGETYKLTFRFKLYWADGNSKGRTTLDRQCENIIPELSIYPFVFRITASVNPNVYNSLTSGIFDYPDIGPEPPKMNDLEPEIIDIYNHINGKYLSKNYKKDISNINTILDYLIQNGEPDDTNPYSVLNYSELSIDRLNYAKEYLKKKITEDGLISYQNLLKNPYVLTCDIQNISLFDVERFDSHIYTRVYYETNPEAGIGWKAVEDESGFPFKNIWMYLPDSRETSLRDVVTFKIEATYTDPETFLSVNALNYYTLKQRPYPGNRTGYIKMNYMDNNPLELWSPYIEVVYGQSMRDEANTKVNKNLNTEYLGFIINDSSFSPKKQTYENYAKLYKKNILKNTYVVDGQETEVTADNINDYILKITTDYDFYNTHVNILDLDDVSINHYFYDDSSTNADSIYSDYDFVQFKNRWNFCASVGTMGLLCIQEPKEQQLLIDKQLVSTDGKFVNKPLDVSILSHYVSFNGKYTAYYARYKIINKDYRQIFGEIQTETTENIEVTLRYEETGEYADKDIDISEYIINIINNNWQSRVNSGDMSVNVGYATNNAIFGAPYSHTQNDPGSVMTFEDAKKPYQYTNTDNISDYKIVQTIDGNSTQYKFCINNVLYEGDVYPIDASSIVSGDNVKINYDSWPPDKTKLVDIQVPRFGVYGKYLGLFAYEFDIYNYETTDVPFIDMTETKDNKPIIVTSGTSLSDINRYFNLVDPSLNTHVSGESVTPVYTEEIHEQQSSAVYGSSKTPKLTKSSKRDLVYGANNDNIGNRIYNYLYFKTNVSNVTNHIFLNGVRQSLHEMGTQNDIDPYINIIHLEDNFTFTKPYILNGYVQILNNQSSEDDDDMHPVPVVNCDSSLLITNSENEKHIKKYSNYGHDIDTNLDSFMILRTNPKLTGNVKLVVDTDYNIYIDTFKASPKLNDQRYRKQAVPADGNYPYDIKRIFATLPNTELFKVPENSLKAHKVYDDFNDQFETMYEYGAETNKDNLYNENMKILAPLHIGKDVPDFFTIFRYDEILNNEAYNTVDYKDIDKLKEILSKSETVMTYDLREYTSIGTYLNNYKNMLTNYGQCYLQFIEEDNYKQSHAYRQGTNIWKGISINRGILTNQSETSYFAAKILDSSIANKQEVFNNFIMQGFERNELLYPNIINLEFMFNDNSQEEYSMHRYFGLYLTENDFIKYGYIVPDQVINRPMKRYDTSGNIYVGDKTIYNQIFNEKYASRLFYAVTNDIADRVKSETDINKFLVDYVQNKPEKNMLNIHSDLIEFGENDKSFITLHLSEPLHYGEHIKFVALNVPRTNSVYNDLNSLINASTSVLPYNHIVYEIIASNSDDLRYCDNYISPVETVNDCRYSENTIFHRISFYSQDIDYPNIPAAITEQIERIVSCIKKFKTFIRVESYNNHSLSVISEYDEMYVQHIAAHDFDDFNYDYYNIVNNNINPSTGVILTTNASYNDSISFIPHKRIRNVDYYEQVSDEEHDWLISTKTSAPVSNTVNSSVWTSYVETEDPSNIKEDTISYFNAFEKFKMYALSNQSDYFDGYYAAFSNYGFESIGWRYNIVVKFLKVSQMKNNYNLYDDQVYNFIKTVKYPIVMTDDNMYETINLFNIENGYLKNNIIDPDYISGYTISGIDSFYPNIESVENLLSTQQQFKFEQTEFQIISSPYNVDYSMIMTNGDALLKNNQVQLYKPKYANIAIMGINNIKDIDTIVNTIRPIRNTEKLITYARSGETLKLDESDYRIQHAVVYELHKGTIIVNGIEISAVTRFMVVPTETEYRLLYDVKDSNDSITTSELKSDFIMAKTDIEIKIIDRQCYQVYDYTTYVPQIHVDHLYRDINDIEHSDLQYSINPLVNCNWKSNGQYYDFNNVLDTSNLQQDYEFIGNFVENVYTPALYNTNQYVTNKVDNILFIDDTPVTFRDAIINNLMQHPIKHLLIDHANIDTAIAYYNSNIQALEFIFSGVKFEIKLNSKVVNTHIHLESYDNYEVFVINDYNISKRNEIFISQVERFILLVNHQFYIDYAHEAHNNVKRFGDDGIKAYADYSVIQAPYAINFKTAHRDHTVINGFTYRKSLQDSLFKAIDMHNLWSSYFMQYDNILLTNNFDVNSPVYIYAPLKYIAEYGNYLTIDEQIGSAKIGYNYIDFVSSVGYASPSFLVQKLSDGVTEVEDLIHFMQFNDIWLLPDAYSYIPIQYSEQHPYIITKADGEYNHLAKTLLSNLNKKIMMLSKYSADISSALSNMQEMHPGEQGGIYNAPRPNAHSNDDPKVHFNDTNYFDRFGLRAEFDIIRMREIEEDDINITANQNLFISYQDNNDFIMSKLSDILGTPVFMLIADEFTSNEYKNYYIPKPYLDKLQKYIEVLIVGESHYKKLQRYTTSINDEIDIHIITVDNGVKHIYNTETYNPLMFKLTIPNMIKYNQGWFTPNMINMVDFSVDDKLSEILDVDLIQANTDITGINYIRNYPGNKVFDDNRIYTLDRNYFFIENKSLIDTTWDKHYYRKYTDEDNFVYQEGHITGIDDKSFFGSRCMVIHHPYILIDTWEYATANDILTYTITNSAYNVESTNTANTVITINITAAIYNHFINNKAFIENWNFFNDTQYTGMKNYINKTITSYYNMNSNIEVIVYEKDIDHHELINILTIKPFDIQNYSVIEGLNVSAPELKNDFYTITIVVPFSEGKNIYPNLKIYRK